MMRVVLLSLICFLALVPGSALGTVVQDLSLAQMTERADWIVRGTVNSKEARWQESERRGIFTQLELSLLEVLKGPAKAGQTMTFDQFGGTVGGITHKIPGAPQFALGEEVLLFLSRHHSGRLYVVGFSQGKFTVSREEDGPQVSRNLEGIQRVTGFTSSKVTPGHQQLRDLGVLQRTIRTLVSEATRDFSH